MATLAELANIGELVLVRVRLGRNEFADRRFYAVPEFMSWLQNEVKAAHSFYSDDLPPRMQAAMLLKRYITGEPFIGSRMFKRMSPSGDDVWEMKSPDLRFFGWVPERDVFVAVKGGLFEDLKALPSLYEQHRIETKSLRASIDLDEPKYLIGAQEHDIVSE